MDIKKNNYTFAIAFRNESMYLITSYHGEMVEWSITTVLKTVVPRGTGGSNPSLSANKGVNQQVMRFTPFITPKKFLGISCMVYCSTMSEILFLRIIQSY